MEISLNFNATLKVKGMAKAIQSSAEDRIPYHRALELASKEAGYPSWHAVVNEKKHLPSYVVTVHSFGPYLGGDYCDGWKRLKSDLSWAPISTCDQRPSNDDFYSTQNTMISYTSTKFLTSIGLIDDPRDDEEWSLNEICGVLATLQFRVFRSNFPKKPTYIQFLETVGPILEKRNPDKFHEYIFLDNQGNFSLSPRLTKDTNSYCLKYNPEIAVHQKLSYISRGGSLSDVKKARNLYFDFIESWMYHLTYKTPMVPATEHVLNSDLRKREYLIEIRYQGLEGKWKSAF